MWHHAVNRRNMPILFCLSFANRASDSGDLYIDVNLNHLTFPVAYLVCQDYAWIIFFLLKHAYALDTTSRISCHVYVVVVYFVVCFFPVLLLRVSSDNVAIVRIRSSTSVCLLHGLVLLPCGISGKMTIPSKSLLSLLARLLALLLCLCCDTYHLLVMPPILLNQASNTPCPSKPLFGYVTALLSPSYSVVSCR